MEPGYIILGLIIAAGLAFIPASIAGQKGRSFGAWYFYGLLLWIVAIFHAISLPYPEKSGSVADKSENEQPRIVLNSTSQGRSIDINSPVYIEGYDVVKSGENKTGLSIRFRNMCSHTVTAIKLTAVGCNSFGDVVQIDGKDEFCIIIQDLNEKPSSYFVTKRIIPLPSDEIRKVELSVSQVCFSDGTKSFHQPEYTSVDRCKIEGDDLKAAQLIMSGSKCFPVIKDTYWMCACGRANRKTENTCMLCGKSKEYIFNAFSGESIAKAHNDIEQEKAKRLAAVAVQDKKNEKDAKTGLIITTSIIALCVVICVVGIIINIRNQQVAKIATDKSTSETVAISRPFYIFRLTNYIFEKQQIFKPTLI